jgi:hypothetical protein
MRAATLMLALLAVGCAKNVDPDDPKTWGSRKVIWLFVAPEKELKDACAQGTMPQSVTDAARTGGVNLPRRFNAVDVLIPKELLDKPAAREERPRLPYSCVSRLFFEHDVKHGGHDVTVIKLKKSAGESAVFRSLQPFKIVEIRDRDHGGKEPYPFSNSVLALPTAERELHETGPIVRSFPPASFLGVTYKVVFLFGTIRIDPDIECKP